MHVLVTGGAGFIGSHLVTALFGRGHSVRVFDNLSTGSRENLTGVEVELIVDDLENWEAITRAVSGCEVIFHQAAMVSVPRSVSDPILNHRSNVDGTFHLFEAARRAGVRRIVYASSAAVYGDSPVLPASEDALPAPLSPYGAAKYIAEIYAGAYAAAYRDGPEFAGLRYMNVFGPRQDPSSPYSGALSVFCQQVLNGETCRVFGDGEQTRDFVYVGDVVDANLLASTAVLPVRSSVFNIGRGEETSVNRVLTILGQLTGHPVRIEYEAERPGDARHSVADISLARSCLGYEPQTSLIEGLRLTLSWFGQQRTGH